MNQVEQDFLRSFFQAVAHGPIEFDGKDDQRYVKLYEDPNFEEYDPVKLLLRAIEYSQGQSVQLLSGYRGSGKSTELRRLRSKLDRRGVYKVALFDIQDYLSPSQPIDVSDFLFALAGGLGDALLEAGHVSKDLAHEGYWTRMVNFLTRTNVEVTEFSAGVSANVAAPDKEGWSE